MLVPPTIVSNIQSLTNHVNFTYVYYNGVVLDVIEIKRLEAQAIRSQGDVDYLYTEYSLEVTAIFNPLAVNYTVKPDNAKPPLNYGPIGGVANSPTLTTTTVRHYLTQPHQPLVLAINGEAMLVSPNYDDNQKKWGSIDENNGPQPEAIVTQTKGAKTFDVTFRVKTWIRECPSAAANSTNGLLSNRWTFSQTTNEDLVTTMRIQGVAVFSSQILASLGQHQADQFRASVLPRIPKGYRRTGFEVGLNDLGNTLTYSVVDTEQPISIGDTITAGYGVCSFEATHAVSISPQNPEGNQSPYVHRSMSCRAKGIPQSYRQTLVVWATKLIYQRMGIQNNPGDHDPRIVSYQVTEHLNRKEVEVAVQVYQAPDTAADPPDTLIGLMRNAATRKNDSFGIFNDALMNGNNGSDGFNPQPLYDEGTRQECRLLAAKGLLDACTAALDYQTISSLGKTSSSTTPDNSAMYYSDPACYTAVVGLAANDTAAASLVGLVAASNNFSSPTTWHSQWILDQKVVSPEGRFLLPVAAPDGTPPMTVKTHARYQLMVVDWTAERIGKKPLCPNPYVNTPTMKLIKIGELSPASPELTADMNSKIYRVSGRYYYALTNTVGVTGPGGQTSSPFSMGALPWIQESFTDSDLQLTDSDFVHGIIDDANGGTATGAIGGATVGIKSQV